MTKENVKVATPWYKNVGDIPIHLDYFAGTMFEKVEETAKKYSNYIAFDFMGKSTTYAKFLENIKICACAMKKLGIEKGEKVTIIMPNCPQAIVAFYAVNLVGAIASMVHPLSAEKEIEFYLQEAGSKTVFTLDQFYGKIKAVKANTSVENIILAKIKDELPPLVKLGFMLTEAKKIPKIVKTEPVIYWKDFMNSGKSNEKILPVNKKEDAAVILYSGGTTGKTKGILLSNYNFNALSAQILATNPMYKPGDKMLAAMPVFHGFGLGVCIHSMLTNGGRCLLVPRFTPSSYAKLITKYHCNFIAGVPTLFEALLRLPGLEKADYSSLKGVYSGGDSLSIELKRKFDSFLQAHGAKISVREGYGTTECVTASCLTPIHMVKEGSIGLPFPDTYYKIVKPDTDEVLPFGEEGEILLAGPTVMMEYINCKEETEKTLRKHADGMTWVYTGDLGYMDEDGFIYFKGRIKRMIISSGYNIYPAQLENIIDAHEAVHMSCVIGVKDSYKMQKVKAFVMLKAGFEKNEETKQSIMDYCKKNMAKYALPYEIEFRDKLPTTLVGKVAYRKLEEEENAKQNG